MGKKLRLLGKDNKSALAWGGPRVRSGPASLERPPFCMACGVPRLQECVLSSLAGFRKGCSIKAHTAFWLRVLAIGVAMQAGDNSPLGGSGPLFLVGGMEERRGGKGLKLVREAISCAFITELQAQHMVT